MNKPKSALDLVTESKRHRVTFQCLSFHQYRFHSLQNILHCVLTGFWSRPRAKRDRLYFEATIHHVNERHSWRSRYDVSWISHHAQIEFSLPWESMQLGHSVCGGPDACDPLNPIWEENEIQPESPQSRSDSKDAHTLLFKCRWPVRRGAALYTSECTLTEASPLRSSRFLFSFLFPYRWWSSLMICTKFNTLPYVPHSVSRSHLSGGVYG